MVGENQNHPHMVCPPSDGQGEKAHWAQPCNLVGGACQDVGGLIWRMRMGCYKNIWYGTPNNVASFLAALIEMGRLPEMRACVTCMVSASWA